MRGESGSDREAVSPPKLYMVMSPSYSNKSSATSINQVNKGASTQHKLQESGEQVKFF